MGIISPKKKENIGSRIFVFLFLLIFLPIVLIYLLLYVAWGTILCIAIWLSWEKRNILFVYSNSPTWKDYMEREILPHLQDRAVILNWSERKNWKNSLAVLAFRYFGGQRNFNPMAVVFRPLRLAKTYRFYEAFKELKYGNPNKVEQLKIRLLHDIGS